MVIKIKKNRVLSSGLFSITIVLLWILFAYNYDNNDLSNYKMFYELKEFYPELEMGYQVLCKLCSLFFSFEEFQIVLATSVLFLIGKFIWKNAEYPALTLMMYGIFPFVLDTIQYRNTIVECIVLLALFELEKYKSINKKRGLVLYVALILFAASFHMVALFYLLYLVVLVPFEKIKKIVFFLFVAECVVVFIEPNALKQILILSGRAMKVYGQGNWETQIYTRVLFLVFICVIPVMFAIFDKHQHKSNINEMVLVELSKTVSYVSVLLYPFFLISVDFFRIYRNLIILMEIGLLNFISKMEKRGERLFWIFVLLVFNVALAIVFIYMYSNNFDNLMHNKILEKFFN